MDRHGEELPAPRLSGEVTGIHDDRPVDDIDRRIIIALQQDGRASWRAIAESIGVAVSTVSRRGQQLISDGVIRVGVMPTLGSGGHVESFLVRINCAPGTIVQVAEELVASPYVRFATVVTGKFDIYAEVVITGSAAQQTRVLTGLRSIVGIERWRSDLLTNQYKVSFDWGRQLYETEVADAASVATMPAPNSCGPEHFDDADRQLVAELSVDGRASFPHIASKLGMNESSVRRRYERLRRNGCISTVTIVPAAVLGMSAEILMILRVAPSEIENVATALRRHLAVRFLAAGLDESSLYCEVILPSTLDLHRFQTQTLGKLNGVKGWTACMELVFMKRGFNETPRWREQIIHDDGDMPPRPWLQVPAGSVFN